MNKKPEIKFCSDTHHGGSFLRTALWHDSVCHLVREARGNKIEVKLLNFADY